MASSGELQPPPEMNMADPGAHQLSEPESSDSEDQFTDAQSNPMTPHVTSPIPITRVEKVDSVPSYGEVPGTEAHDLRKADAQPDEIAVANDFMDEDLEASIETPRQEVPITVLEPVRSDSLGSPVPTRSPDVDVDAKPDIVLEIATEGANTTSDVDENNEQEEQGDEFDDEFGDDFDDFEEGAQDAEFDDFEDGFQQPQPSPAASYGAPPALLSQLPFPIPDYDGLSPDEVLSATEQCLDSLFSPEELDLPIPETLPNVSSLFLTPRSASLWSQLVAPPPLAPPDWIRSRTRRLFLVSLGVPVDLDEILPASKQKKLILPSLNLRATSPSSGGSRSASRRRQDERNTSSTSVDTQGKPAGFKKRKGPPPEPELDLVAARYLCTTTDEALDGMTDEELKQHVGKLEAMQGTAQEVLDYWRKRTDEKVGDREAFEGVIENLVKHARKVRQ
ncbi:hypothetical protein E4U42_003341 [Claviceps africana]|uniref:Uncharacterized protein n=1 Tax=Claviceps africana TaxID=83212 RepID=A0A8K0JD07_9HYPO|nr:hypothetical protein E4U42_003341 [Claviceps africana]